MVILTTQPIKKLPIFRELRLKQLQYIDFNFGLLQINKVTYKTYLILPHYNPYPTLYISSFYQRNGGIRG